MLKHRFYGGSTDETPSANSKVANVTFDSKIPSEQESIDAENDAISTNKSQLKLIMDIDKTDPTTLFKDGVRKIDFVLVIEEVKQQTKTREVSETTSLCDDDDEEAIKNLRKQQKIDVWRQRFMGRIISQGLEFEEEICDQEENILRFIKLHGPWKLLCQYAEDLNIEVPLQEIPKTEESQFENGTEAYLANCCFPNIMYQEVPNKPKRYYTTPFRMDKLAKFIGIEDPDTFFSPAQRSRMVYELLATTPFGKEKKGEVGIDRLVNDGAYAAAFPLHAGPYKDPNTMQNTKSNQVQPMILSSSTVDLNERQVLYEYWARWGRWYKYQPLGHIRNYFGEKIAIYFAWLGFYTAWLLPAMCVGILVFMYGLFTVSDDKIIKEVCEDKDNVTLCPICDICPTKQLKETCFPRKAGYLFDNGASVFFAIFMSFWAVFFLEFWKRRAASLAHDWNCMDLEELEVPRPEFAAKAPYREKNKITGKEEPSFPEKIRLKRMLVGSGIILVMILVVFIVLMSVILYRVFVAMPMQKNHISVWMLTPTMFATSTGAILQIACIMLLGRFYQWIALILTKWEMHRTQSEFDDNLTFKVFLFQFINFNAAIFYVAFFKGKFEGRPGKYNTFMFGVRNENCSSGGCQYDLMLQLMWIMVGKQVINNFQEILIPKFKIWYHGRKSNLDKIGESRMEDDFKLAENEGLFEEYLEMILQFGFITIFVASFPLAPVFALLNNWVEIRLDAQKFICDTRRAVAERAKDIGIWFSVLSVVTQIAVVTNAFLISFTSDFIERSYYSWNKESIHEDYTSWRLALSPSDYDKEPCYYAQFRDDEGDYTLIYWKILALKLGFVIAFEHFVFGIGRCIDLLVPDIPETLQIKIKREQYLAKQILSLASENKNFPTTTSATSDFDA